MHRALTRTVADGQTSRDLRYETRGSLRVYLVGEPELPRGVEPDGVLRTVKDAASVAQRGVPEMLTQEIE